MIPNKLKRLWAEGKPTLNGWCSIGNAFTAEIMAAQATGLKPIAIKMEHALTAKQEIGSIANRLTLVLGQQAAEKIIPGGSVETSTDSASSTASTGPGRCSSRHR